MPCTDSNLPKSICYFALIGERYRIARNCPLYKDFNEKATELHNEITSSTIP